MAISAKVSERNQDVTEAPARAVASNGTITLQQPSNVLLSLSPTIFRNWFATATRS